MAVTSIMAAASRRPGMMPPANSAAMETPGMRAPYMTMQMLGGMMGEMTELAAVTATENSAS